MTVYIFQAGASEGPVKIGCTTGKTNVRLSAVQTGSADELTLLRECPGNRTVEKWLHKKFKANHIRGEWFVFHSDMLTIAVPAALVDADGGSEMADSTECAAIDIAGHQASLLRAFKCGSEAMSQAMAVRAHLNEVLAVEGAHAIEAAESQYRDLCKIAEHWDQEIRRLDSITDGSGRNLSYLASMGGVRK